MLEWGDNQKSFIGADTAEDFVGAGTIDIAQVQLNVGDKPVPYMPKSYAEELRDCQRYYESYVARAINGTLWIPWKVKKRITPTIAASAGTVSNPTVDGCILTHIADADTTITATSEM
jgi:hypothetical protein